MRSGYSVITVLMLFVFFYSGCISNFIKRPAISSDNPVVTNGIKTVNDMASSIEVSGTAGSNSIKNDSSVQNNCISETPVHTSVYSKEEATLSDILNIYKEAEEALNNRDYSLAEALIDKAAVLSSGIDISAINDESLALRYKNIITLLFQDYGRIFKDVDKINLEDPLKWLEQLSEINPEKFRKGKWKDDELLEVVRKISLRCDMPVELNNHVKNSIYFFQTAGKRTMEEWVRRSGRYVPVIQEILEEQGLPLDLAYLAMIESGFNPRAYSHKHCSGFWQFGSSTGGMYGLKRTQWYDQRNDPVKSTKAAAEYLNDLYKMYDDWLLVMAAYNWGPTRVNRQIKKGVTDFWLMDLPSETKNFVPSFMAAVIILKAPELFGFENISKEAPLSFDTVEVPYTSLKTAAKCAGVELKIIKDMNPELLKPYTPAAQKYSLKIPAGKRERFLAEYIKQPKEKYLAPKVDQYYVKKGDSLWTIAVRHNTSVSMIQSLNNMGRKTKIIPGQKLIVRTNKS